MNCVAQTVEMYVLTILEAEKCKFKVLQGWFLPRTRSQLVAFSGVLTRQQGRESTHSSPVSSRDTDPISALPL